MRRVILESPFAGKTPEETKRNVFYARACVRDCLMRGDAPFASHLLYTQPGVLRDDVPSERGMGMRAGLSWTPAAEAVVVYTDRGISSGMRAGIGRAENAKIPVEYRKLPHWVEVEPDDAQPAHVCMSFDARGGEAAGKEGNAIPEIVPHELADLLLAAGVDITPSELTKKIATIEEANLVARWARTTHAVRCGENVVIPKLPHHLSELLGQAEENS